MYILHIRSLKRSCILHCIYVKVKYTCILSLCGLKKLKDKGQTRRWHKRVGTCMKLHVCTYIRFQISNYPGSFLPRLLWLTPNTIGALFSMFIIRLLFLFRHLAPSFTNNFIPLCMGLNRSSLYQKKNTVSQIP